MKRKDLNRIIASLGVISLGLTAPLNSFAEVQSVNNVDTINEINETTIVMNTDKEKMMYIEQEGQRLKAEREEAEKQRILEEQKRIEQERIAEENRKQNVSVDLDNVLHVSNINTEELIAVFDYYEYAHNMKELAWIFVQAEQVYGLNAFILAGIASWESTYNTSCRAVNNNNVLGWGVYSDISIGINASSKYENIMNAAKFLKEEYLTPSGIYFNGYTTWGLNQNYCLDANGEPNDEWRIGINSIAKNYEWAYKNIVR